MLMLSDPTTHHGIVSRLREWISFIDPLNYLPASFPGKDIPTTLQTYLLVTLPSTYIPRNSPFLKHFSQLCEEPQIRNWLEYFEKATTYDLTFTQADTADNTQTSLPYSYLSGTLPCTSPITALPAANITSPGFTTTSALWVNATSNLPAFHITTSTTHIPSNTSAFFPENGVFNSPFLTPKNSETYQLCLQYQKLHPSPLLCLLLSTSHLNEHGNNQVPLDLAATEIAQQRHTVVELLTKLQSTCQPLGVRVGTATHTQELDHPLKIAQELTFNRELHLRLPKNAGAFALTLHKSAFNKLQFSLTLHNALNDALYPFLHTPSPTQYFPLSPAGAHAISQIIFAQVCASLSC